MGVAADEILVGTIGRASPEKNLEMLLAVMAALPAQLRCRAAIVGDGPSLQSLRMKAVTMGLGDRAIFTGERDDVAPLLGAMDIFALTSRTEGLPNAVMEAMACRRAVVATDVGGTAELIEDGVSGFLVASEDSATMTERIAALARSARQRELMGEAAHARIVSDFTAGIMAARTADIYEKALQGPLR
jgi:glycosyltransferase involved in cell wall biosynthesis